MDPNPIPILRRKIAASQTRRAELQLPVESMSEALAGVVASYFSLKLKPPPLSARVADPQRLALGAGERVWYLFHAGAADIIVSLDFVLTIAATNMAIGRKFSEAEEAKPSLADRAIAAGFAQRAAAAIASVKALPDSAPAFVQSSWSFSDIKIDRGGARFEWYEAVDIALTDSLKVTFAGGVSVDSAHSGGALLAGGNPWEARLFEIAMEAGVRLDANLGQINTSIDSLMSLAPGVTLPVAAFSRDNIPLTVRGSPVPVMSGKIGGQNGFKAIRIQSPAFG